MDGWLPFCNLIKFTHLSTNWLTNIGGYGGPAATTVGSYPPGPGGSVGGAGQQPGVAPYQPHFNRPPPTGTYLFKVIAN